MYLLMIVAIVIGYGVMNDNVIVGAGIIVSAIILGDIFGREEGASEWITSVIFLVGIASVPVIVAWSFIFQ